MVIVVVSFMLVFDKGFVLPFFLAVSNAAGGKVNVTTFSGSIMVLVCAWLLVDGWEGGSLYVWLRVSWVFVKIRGRRIR
jgi:hypothetical protein